MNHDRYAIRQIESLESTNKYCEVLDLSQVGDFTCFWALAQTAGVGQQGNHWHASPGLNLTFSLVLHPPFLPAARQFRLTQALSLALADMLDPLLPHHDIRIKWPNDIYVDGHKICGTLVSTRLRGDAIGTAICGIGLNVNEREFPSWVPRPTSIALLTGMRHELRPLLVSLLGHIEAHYLRLQAGHDPQDDYLRRLMNLGIMAHYSCRGQTIDATITGVDSFGHLLLTDSGGNSHCCAMKEIALLS